MRKVPAFSKVSKKEHLIGIRKRLMDDVEPYIRLVDNSARNGKLIGFWSLGRMLFPIIETVAQAVYHRHGADQILEIKLLRALGIRCPVLVWQMYRNSLMHNDCLQKVIYNNQEITWSISASGLEFHKFKHNKIHIDMKRLHIDLKRFLDEVIHDADPDEMIELQTAVCLFDPLTSAVQSELFRMNQS